MARILEPVPISGTRAPVSGSFCGREHEQNTPARFVLVSVAQQDRTSAS